MSTFAFTVVVQGADLQRNDIVDVLFEAGCDDARRKKITYGWQSTPASNCATVIRKSLNWGYASKISRLMDIFSSRIGVSLAFGNISLRFSEGDVGVGFLGSSWALGGRAVRMSRHTLRSFSDP